MRGLKIFLSLPMLVDMTETKFPFVERFRQATLLARVKLGNLAMDLNLPPFNQREPARPLHTTSFFTPPPLGMKQQAEMYPSRAVDMMRQGFAFYTHDDIRAGLAASGRTQLTTEEHDAVLLAQKSYVRRDMQRLCALQRLPDNPFPDGVAKWGRYYYELELLDIDLPSMT